MKDFKTWYSWFTFFVFLVISIIFTLGLSGVPDYNVNQAAKINFNKIEKVSAPASTSTKLIEADLNSMRIYTYEGGVLTGDYNIISKGRPGSYYETPSGEFKIKSKQTDKFSSIGKVYMPYSMQFFGNFFIHGIPYYPSGQRVSSTYSGGCIRLSDADAKSIYNFANFDTKVIIKNQNKNIESGNNYSEVAKNEISKEKIKSMYLILLSLESVNQEIYISHNRKTTQIKDLNHYTIDDNKLGTDMLIKFVGDANYINYYRERLESMNIDVSKDPLLDDPLNTQIILDHIIENKSFVLTYL